MTTTEVRGAADPPEGGAPPAEVLAIAPRPVGRGHRRLLATGVMMAALSAGGYLGWQQLKPPPDFTLAQLQGAYTGMVRSDGTNDVSTIDASKFTDPALTTTPAQCAPLFASTVSNQFPAGAVDGVSTYWLDDGSASVSLFTVRYPDADGAQAAYRSVEAAEAACDGRRVRLSGGEGAGELRAVPVAVDRDHPDQLAYRWDRAGQGRYALHVLRLSNTITWQYRYEYGAEAYDPTAAQQLMAGLRAQLLSIQAAGAS